ncbi:MAG: AAA family ATPase [Bacteroidota bacterium]
MPNISLKVPTLIREVRTDEQRYYHIRPLFINYPFITDHRYEQALSYYKKELKQYFRGYELKRNSLNYLLWHIFPAEIEYRLVDIDTRFDGWVVKGKIGAAIFEFQNYTFVALPFVKNFMFMAKVSPKNRSEFAKEIARITKQLLLKIKERENNNFAPKNYLSTPKEFVTIVEQKAQIEHAKFSFEQNPMQDLFSSMRGNSEFTGSIELEKVARGLSYFYPTELKRAYHREEEVQYLYQSLFESKTKMALAIIGEIGVGRHTLVEEAIWQYMEHSKNERKSQFWLINPNRIIAGMSIVGMWQKRFEAILEHAKQPYEKDETADTIIFDNPIALLRIGKTSQNSMTLSNVLKPYLENRTLQTILIATPEEWKVLQETDRRFADLFQVMRVQPAETSTAVKMILHQRREVEKANNCQFSVQAVHQLLNIHRVYLKKEALPGGVMKLMNQMASKYRGQSVDLNIIRQEFKSTFGLEERIFEDSYRFEEDEVHNTLAAQLVGQPKAVKAITKSVHLIKAKLANPDRPLSSFMFIGPTGVGKTQAAKVLCKYLMGEDKHLLRFDMNEYVDGYAIQRLIGDEYNPEGILTGKVRYRSFGVILLDEIEKAHRDVHDLLLQVLDDGRLTDSLGRVVDFSNFIIIMTSNVGAQEVDRQISTASAASASSVYRKAVERHFRPEFVNRIDEIVVFNPLDQEHVLNIARLQINELLQRDGFLRRTTILNISQETLAWIARRGYNKKMGGRALKRQIEKDLTAVSAAQLIDIQGDHPIIFQVDVDEPTQQLKANIHPLRLELAPEGKHWNPLENTDRSVYNHLLRRLERLSDRLRDYQDEQVMDEEDNWQFYQLTNTLMELRESINMTKLRAGEAELPYNAPITFKGLERLSSANGISDSRNILYDIRENYRHNQPLLDKEYAPLVHYSIDALLLEMSCESYFSGGEDHFHFRIYSYAEGYGQYECQFLMQKYEALFQELDLSYEKEESNYSFHINGHAAQQLLEKECGVHLFYTNYQMPVPIQVVINEDASNRVIRICDGADTMTDLRSGFIVSTDFSVQEHKVMIVGGMTQKEVA